MGFGLAGHRTFLATAGLQAGAVRLQLDEVADSATVYHRVHGSVEATLLSEPENQGGAVLTVRATF